jgi:aminomethyltransferase
MAGTPGTDGAEALSRTPLYDEHVALGAMMVPFAGWSMPVKYASDVAEHHAVRSAAGLFDISHMAEIEITGPDAAAFCDRALSGRLSALVPLQSKYTMILAETGGIIDDLIVTALPDAGGPRFAVVANASNRAPVVSALSARAASFAGDVTVTDVSDEYALIAVQGPYALAVLEATPGLVTDEGVPEFGETKYYRNTTARFGGEAVRVARSGYTGEDGYELLIPAASGVALWRALLASGEPFGLVPAGLAARDTLRLEAGMPLYGHELSLDVLPVQAGLGRVVATDKDDFVGKDAVLAGPAPDARVLVGLTAEGRRAGRAGYAVMDAAGEPVGEITSGVLSPTLGHPVAMAYVQPRVSAPGTLLAFDVRGTAIPATVTTPPFYRRPRA